MHRRLDQPFDRPVVELATQDSGILMANAADTQQFQRSPSRRRKRSRGIGGASNTKRHPGPFVFFLLLLSATAWSFQVSASRTHNHHSSSSTSSSSSLSSSSSFNSRTKLAVSSCIAPPEHHLAWLQSQEKQNKQGRTEKTSFLPNEIDWLSSKGDEDVPFDALTSFNDTSAKDAWAARYTTVEGLRRTFGRNKNILWGDLDAVTTRRLYKTLLPRALLELYHCHGASSEDLAPLAYRARVAAKLYARERSTLPARMGACLFDGIRQFRKYGSFQMSGMSYMQLWEKYAEQVMQEEDWEDEDDLTSKICYKILQKSCETNSAIDSLLLQEDAMDLQEITRKLEKEVYDLIRDDDAARQWSIQRYKTLKTLLRIKRRLEHVTNPDESHHNHHHRRQHNH